jgi:hypothetical protein
MKLAFLIALSEDKRTAKAIGQGMPYDEGLAEYKRLTSEGTAPSDELPLLELWSANGVSKSYRFKNLPGPKRKKVEAPKVEVPKAK